MRGTAVLRGSHRAETALVGFARFDEHSTRLVRDFVGYERAAEEARGRRIKRLAGRRLSIQLQTSTQYLVHSSEAFLARVLVNRIPFRLPAALAAPAASSTDPRIQHSREGVGRAQPHGRGRSRCEPAQSG